MRHYKIWRVLEGLEGPKRPRCICFFYNVFRGSKLIHGYIVCCGRLLECLSVIVRRVLEGSWRVLEGLGGSSQDCRALMVSMSLGVSLRVQKGLRGFGWVREGLGGSKRLRESPGRS